MHIGIARFHGRKRRAFADHDFPSRQVEPEERW
jgi:hypothetical protein